MEIFNKAILNIFPRNYFADMVEFIIATYKIVIIPLEDLLL